MPTASSSTSSSCRWKYDVFLSFRGEDTRKSFIDHLYTAFNQKGLHVFRDDKELERGKPISPELSFETYGPGSEVKKCGIHPVYEKEIEELKPRAKKSSRSSFWNSYELDEDFLISTADVDCNGAEDEDVIYFSADDEPVQPKRLKSS